MEYHLEYGLRLNSDLRPKVLYSWAINEIRPDGGFSRDQIPWRGTLDFSATSCVLTSQFEIASRFSLVEDSYEPPQIKAEQTIRIALQPPDDTAVSMFGTKREIKEVTLEIRPLVGAAKQEFKEECCRAWGSVSYTSEVDLRDETFDDCMFFYLYVKPETFSAYSVLINQGAIDTVILSVGAVDGFYAEWSPANWTNSVKVLGSHQQLDLPPDFQGAPPRLGRVHNARLRLNRRLDLRTYAK